MKTHSAFGTFRHRCALSTATFKTNSSWAYGSLTAARGFASVGSEAPAPGITYDELGLDAADPQIQKQLKSFAVFNKKGGKFRVAVLNACNMNCFFCHNEGMENPRTPGRLKGDASSAPPQQKSTGLKRGPEVLSASDLLELMNAFTGLGGTQLNITGGEPLARKDITDILRGIKKRKTRVVLNSNVLLAQRLLKEPKIDNVDAIFASLHSTEGKVFKEQLGYPASGAQDVMDNMVKLKEHGYKVQINYSLGSYNKDHWDQVLRFAVSNGLDLKAIALIRSDENPNFYGGDWIDPSWVAQRIHLQGGVETGKREGFGGRVTVYESPSNKIEIKNIASGRLFTDFCRTCTHVKHCGEGIYALRSGVDGVWKPCLLNKEGFQPIDTKDYSKQILTMIDSMVGDWDRAKFVTGTPM